jgi:hypothetical protein
MNFPRLALFCSLNAALLSGLAAAEPELPFRDWAPPPPMGWNSWDCFATTSTEAQAKELADFIAVKLADLGFTNGACVRDLWTHRDLGVVAGEFAPEIPFHGAGLYRLSSK